MEIKLSVAYRDANALPDNRTKRAAFEHRPQGAIQLLIDKAFADVHPLVPRVKESIALG